MPRSVNINTNKTSSDGQAAVRSIRETIAHFFGGETESKLDTPVNEHTLRDIGVNRTIFDNM